MCGIAGVIGYSEQDVQDMLDLTVYRGRDAQNKVVLEHGVILGHNRLSIQDTSEAANQPMQYGDYWIVYNGELWDGWQEMRTELEDLGHEFETTSDTEAILKGYIEWGVDVIPRLNGMFSFAIYDGKQGLLILAKDWVGKLPLHYIESAGHLAFCSSKKVFPAIFEIPLNQIRDVLPGTYKEYNLETQQFDRTTKFYELPTAEITDDFETAKSSIRQLLEEGVRQRLISDVPVCALLSGGIDSFLVTYLAKKYMPDIEAFVLSKTGVDGDNDDTSDLYWARKCAKWIEVPLHEVYITQDDVVDAVPDVIYGIEQYRSTLIDSATPHTLLARAVGEAGYKVVITGDGIDEVFAGYQMWKARYGKDNWTELCHRLVGELHKHNLPKVNKALMFGGTLEGRIPFLHRPFVEYAINLPYHYKVLGKTSPSYDRMKAMGITNLMKYVLREAFRGEIPDELLYRPKVTLQMGVKSGQSMADDVKAKYGTGEEVSHHWRIYKRIYNERFAPQDTLDGGFF